MKHFVKKKKIADSLLLEIGFMCFVPTFFFLGNAKQQYEDLEFDFCRKQMKALGNFFPQFCEPEDKQEKL